jgi:hypothetical protein
MVVETYFPPFLVLFVQLAKEITKRIADLACAQGCRGDKVLFRDGRRGGFGYTNKPTQQET